MLVPFVVVVAAAAPYVAAVTYLPGTGRPFGPFLASHLWLWGALWLGSAGVCQVLATSGAAPSLAPAVNAFLAVSAACLVSVVALRVLSGPLQMGRGLVLLPLVTPTIAGAAAAAIALT